MMRVPHLLTAALSLLFIGCGSEMPSDEPAAEAAPQVRPVPTPMPQGTERGLPGLDPASIEVRILSDGRVRITGHPGAASGSHLFLRPGEVEDMEAENGETPGRRVPLHADGSFSVTLQLLPGEAFTLWAVGRDGATLQSSFGIPLE